MTDAGNPNTTGPGWLERLLMKPVNLLRWLRMADYYEAKEAATDRILREVGRV